MYDYEGVLLLVNLVVVCVLGYLVGELLGCLFVDFVLLEC